jgi:hypothetical protein
LTDGEFHVLVKESASRISKREETDTIELIDDVYDPRNLSNVRFGFISGNGMGFRRKM